MCEMSYNGANRADCLTVASAQARSDRHRDCSDHLAGLSRVLSYVRSRMKDFGIVVMIVLGIFFIGMIVVCLVAAYMAKGRDNTLMPRKPV